MTSPNVVWHEQGTSRDERWRATDIHGATVWLTGLSGSGKSTIAGAVADLLALSGALTYTLDGDNLRHGLNGDLGFSSEDRAENVRRVAEVGKLMRDAGLVVFVALVSPYRSDREAAAGLFAADEFMEVYIDTPVEVCAERDPKGLYAKAAAGNLPNMTGMGQAYEAPEHADLVLRGTGDLNASVDTLVRAILGE